MPQLTGKNMKLKLFTALTVLTIASTGTAYAESRIMDLCGDGHVNEADDDVVAYPDGYYIRGLQTQLSHGDPRIVNATGDEFHLCTRSAATPDMDTSTALSLMNERTVKYLFVPVD
jgi:hypothetical protein